MVKMPQASEEVRDAITARFGSIDIEGPLQFLHSKGWEMISHGVMRPPKGSISEEEWEALHFLIDEWDFAYDDERL
jgi:hypothetical protein